MSNSDYNVEGASAFIVRWMWKLVLVLMFLLVIQLAIGWYNDYASCQRQVPVRSALNKLSTVEQRAVQNTTDQASKELRHAAAVALHVSQVDCLAPIPSIH